MRRYNADLANDYGNLLNRTLAMTGRYLDGERPAPQEDGRPRERPGPTALGRCDAAIDGFLLHDALAALWSFVGEANRYVDERAAVGARQGRQGGRRRSGRERSAGVLGDLLEACRLVTLAASRRSCPRRHRGPPRSSASRSRTGRTATAARRSRSRWLGRAPTGGRIGAPEPLFPRLEIEAAESAAT